MSFGEKRQGSGAPKTPSEPKGPKPSWMTMGKIEAGEWVAVFDLDDTLSDPSGRRHFVEPEPGGRKDWPAFHAAGAGDPPKSWVVELAREAMALGAKIAIFTGRPPAQRRATIDWLRAQGIEPALLRMRGDRDFRKAPVMKGEWLGELLAGGARALCAVDDEPGNLAAFAEQGVPGVDALAPESEAREAFARAMEPLSAPERQWSAPRAS